MKPTKIKKTIMLSQSKILMIYSMCEGGELFDRLSEEGNFS